MPHARAILWSLATIVASGGIAACDAPDGDLDAEALALEDTAPHALADGALAQEELDALLVGGIAVEDGLRLRDVIHLLRPDALPADLTEADLDQPLVADPQHDDATAAFDGADDLAADIDPLAIGEPQCATASIANATHGAQLTMSPQSTCWEWDVSTSPNASYNPAGCPNQYITEVTSTLHREFDFYALWQGVYPSPNICELSHIYQSAYGGYYVVTWNGTYYTISTKWDRLGTEGRHGEVEGPSDFQECKFRLDEGSPELPHMGPGHGYNRIRVATQGVVFAIWPIKQRIQGGVIHGEPCGPQY